MLKVKEDNILQLPVGQTVVHPNHGIGKITNVTKMDLLEEFKRYYVIDFFTHDLTSRIPVKKADELRLRKTMSEDKVSQVFNTLRALPQGLPDHFKQRRSQIEALLYSGRPVKIAKAVRELTWRKNKGKLSTTDHQLLTKGRKMLIEEITLVTDSKESETRRKVRKALKISINAKEANQDKAGPGL